MCCTNFIFTLFYRKVSISWQFFNFFQKFFVLFHSRISDVFNGPIFTLFCKFFSENGPNETNYCCPAKAITTTSLDAEFDIQSSARNNIRNNNFSTSPNHSRVLYPYQKNIRIIYCNTYWLDLDTLARIQVNMNGSHVCFFVCLVGKTIHVKLVVLKVIPI